MLKMTFATTTVTIVIFKLHVLHHLFLTMTSTTPILILTIASIVAA